MSRVRLSAARTLALVGIVVAVGCFVGCSAGSASAGPAAGGTNQGGGGSAPKSGPVSANGSNANVDCSAFAAAVGGIFPKGVSAPIESEGACTWGIGTNASADASALTSSLTDIFTLKFSYGDDAKTQFEGDSGALSGGAGNLTTIPGVGAAAAYFDGGTGMPQVVAYAGKVECGSHLLIGSSSDASVVGLTPTGDPSHPIAAADTPALAKKIAEACAVGWNG